MSIGSFSSIHRPPSSSLFIGKWFSRYTIVDSLDFSCGRTARLGKLGNALLMLLPNEAAYVNFLLNSQRVPMIELTPPALETIENVVPIVRQLATTDK